jgi:hypothetical protein
MMFDRKITKRFLFSCKIGSICDIIIVCFFDLLKNLVPFRITKIVKYCHNCQTYPQSAIVLTTMKTSEFYVKLQTTSNQLSLNLRESLNPRKWI